jgi:hypothetical protein
VRRALFCALLLALSALPALAQEEPTPFWMAPPPPAPKKEKPKEKKPPPKPKDTAPKPKETAPPPPKKKAPQKEEMTPVPWQKPVQPKPAPPPQKHVVTPPPAAEPEPDLPSHKPHPPASTVVTPPPIAPLIPPAAAVAAQPEPEEEEAAPRREVKHISIDLVAGWWARSRSDGGGSTWDLTWGLRGGYAFFDGKVEAELLALRTNVTEGSPFLSTTLAHTLLELRGFYVLGDRFALLLGAGAGICIAQTHYAIVDPVAQTSSTLDASAYKAVASVAAAGRARIYGGLEARVEVSLLLRDGRVELIPLGGLGFAFW